MHCSTCHNIDESLTKYEASLASNFRDYFDGPFDFSLGSTLDIESRASSCAGCRSIAAFVNFKRRQRAFDSNAVPYTVTAHLKRLQPRLLILIGDLSGVSSNDMSARRANLHHLSSLFCYSPTRVTLDEGRGREAPASVNTDLIKKWIHRCDTAHEHTCIRKYDNFLLPTAARTFIDVEQLCIVTPSDSNVRYIALSYVWGAAQVLIALKSNIAQLRQPGAFERPEFRLPRTVWDAMTLCQRLGVRYLWVDSVCIVQDDLEVKREQLRAMGAVYGEAYFTIAAVQAESADAGIHRAGLVDLTQIQPQVIDLPSRRLIIASSKPAIGLSALRTSGLKWATRGWTLQEQVFSRRIIAMDKVVTWVCFGDQWTEDVEFPGELDSSPPPNRDVNPGHKLGIVAYPSISAYGSLAEEYARRDLSYASDAINAFAGIMTPMSQWFPGGLHFGIAEFTFDVGLLWSTRGTGARLRCDPGTSSFVNGAPQFPTWSWISWTGAVSTRLWSEAEDYLAPRGPLVVTPLVEWQKQLVESGAWSNVDNSYHIVRAHFRPDKNPPALVPEGWTKHREERSGEVYYQHSSHDHVIPPPRFACPIPPFVKYRDIDQREYHPYLRFRGKLARVKLAIDPAKRTQLSTTLESRGAAPEVDIVIDDGRWAGRLMMNPAKGDTLPDVDEMIEVISISEAVLDLDAAAHALYVFQEILERAELAGVRRYEMVNVLWIGRCNNGMVYRKALGRIWKDAWEVVDKEEVELLLT